MTQTQLLKTFIASNMISFYLTENANQKCFFPLSVLCVTLNGGSLLSPLNSWLRQTAELQPILLWVCFPYQKTAENRALRRIALVCIITTNYA